MKLNPFSEKGPLASSARQKEIRALRQLAAEQPPPALTLENRDAVKRNPRSKRRLFKASALLLVLAFVVASGVSVSPAQPQGKRAPREFMRDKLQLSQQVLEGLVTEDFDLVIAKASKLSAMTQEADWRVFQNPDYERYSAEFQRHVDSLRRSAENRNLDGATLAYTKSTQSCIECHKFVRGRKLASIR